jgi:hypothetical protein
MTWAKLDDKANEHRKQLAAGAEACWLWACGLMYANRQRARDGFIPEAAIGMLYPFKTPKRLAERLVEVGLWERTEGGYQIHRFHYWNQNKERYEDKLASGRERAAKSYERRKVKSDDSSREEKAKTPSEESDLFANSSGSTPTPTPTPTPLPKNPTGSSLGGAVAPPAQPKRAPKSVLWPVDSWAGPTDAHRELAAKLGHDASEQGDRMRDWAKSKAERKADWDAAFRNWLKNQHAAPRDERSGTQIRLLRPQHQETHRERVERICAEEAAQKAAAEGRR